MVSGKGFYQTSDGVFKDVGDDEIIPVNNSLTHSKYGRIDYVVYDFGEGNRNVAVKWHDTTGLPQPPNDWEEEI